MMISVRKRIFESLIRGVSRARVTRDPLNSAEQREAEQSRRQFELGDSLELM
jgi:hypothetical protein